MFHQKQYFLKSLCACVVLVPSVAIADIVINNVNEGGGDYVTSGPIIGSGDNPVVVINGENNNASSFTNSGTIKTSHNFSVIINKGTISSFSNESGGKITGGTYGVKNDTGATIGNFTNSGTISSFSNESGGKITGVTFGIKNYAGATISSFTNSGTITGKFGVQNYGLATISNFTNSGIITSGKLGVKNYAGATIGNFINSGTITGGTITGGTSGVQNNGTITSFTNSGTITGETYSVKNDTGATIGNFINSGTITGGTYGVRSTGTIHSFTNSGTITGANAIDIVAKGTGTDSADHVIITNKAGEEAASTTGGLITGSSVGINVNAGSNYVEIINGDNTGTTTSKISATSGSGINIVANAKNTTITNNKTGAILGIAVETSAQNTIINNYADDTTNTYGILSTDGAATQFKVAGQNTTVNNTADGVFSKGIIVGSNSSQGATINNDGTIGADGITTSIEVTSTVTDASDKVTINNNSGGTVLGTTAINVSAASKFTSVENNGAIGDSNTTTAIMLAGDSANITNSGTIKGSTAAIHVTGSASNTTITNNKTGAILGIAVETSAQNTIINNYADDTTNTYGILSTAGAATQFEVAGQNTTVNNKADGVFSKGILVGSNSSQGATINNDGTIKGSTAAIQVTGSASNTTITNNAGGLIKYTGSTHTATNAAIYAEATATINNYGTIDGGSDAGLAIAGTAATQQTVNIYAGSKFIGAIDLAADFKPNKNTTTKLDTINVFDNGSKGSYRFQVRHLGSTNIDIKKGSNAVKVDKKGNHIYVQNLVITNATGAALRPVQLNYLTRNLHSIVRDHAEHLKANKKTKVASLELTPGMLYKPNTPQLWGQLFGQRTNRDAEGALSAYENEVAGFVGGYQYAVGKSEVGILAGFAKSTFTTNNNNQDDDTNSTYIGAYAQTHFSKLNLITSLIAGQENHDNRRKVASASGTEIAKSNNGSVFLSPSVTLYSSFKLNDKLTLQPSTSLNYSIGHYDKYKETGAGNANTTVKARTSDAALANMQLKLAYAIPVGEVNLKAGVQARYSDNDDIDMSLAGSDFSYKSGLDSTVSGDYVGAGANFALAKSFNLAVDSSYSEFSGSEHSVAGKVQLQYSF